MKGHDHVNVRSILFSFPLANRAPSFQLCVAVGWTLGGTAQHGGQRRGRAGPWGAGGQEQRHGPVSLSERTLRTCAHTVRTFRDACFLDNGGGPAASTYRRPCLSSPICSRHCTTRRRCLAGTPRRLRLRGCRTKRCHLRTPTCVEESEFPWLATKRMRGRPERIIIRSVR